MHGVILDAESMGTDINWAAIHGCFDAVESWPATAAEQAAERIQSADIVVVNKVVIGENELAGAHRLKLIAVTATGTNNIDLNAARAKGIRVCNVTQYGAPTIVQHTLSLMFALANRLVDYVDDVRAGKWQESPQFCLMSHPIMELEGKTLGIIGYGDLGQHLARVATALGLRVLLGARPGQPTGEVDGYPRVSLDALLPQVDVLSIHCLLSEETRNLISAKELAQMKPSALLINVARGGIVNEVDLAQALKAGALGGAALDVLSTEPPRDGNVLLDGMIPNLIITPHCAWASREARQRLADKTAENIQRFISETPQAYVN